MHADDLAMTHEHSHEHNHSHSHDGGHTHDHAHGHAVPRSRAWGYPELDSLAETKDRARLSSRAVFAGVSDDAVAADLEAFWAARVSATRQLTAATEETLARIVARHLPNAAMVVLYEDTSHDAPHGHVHTILDGHGHTLIEGTSDQWHDLDWAGDVDDLVWDLHHVDRDGFTDDGTGLRVRRIPIRH